MLRKKILIEGILLLFVSLVCIAEALRLIRNVEPRSINDLLGPGYYILVLSIALMIIGITHIIYNYKKDLAIEKIVVKKGMRLRLISMIIAFAIYNLLIDIVGYLVASIVFFLLEFRIAGSKSWLINIILTLACVGVYYFVFVQYCGMVFPRGIFFK